MTIKLNGKEVRRIRRNLDISQDNIADELKLSQSQYSRVESGQYILELAQVALIAKLLSVNIFDILDFGEAKPLFEKYFNADSSQKENDFLQEKNLLLAQIDELKTDKKHLIEQIKLLKQLSNID
jgi:transcriptional regulator with XRE-family HTH domain